MRTLTKASIDTERRAGEAEQRGEARMGMITERGGGIGGGKWQRRLYRTLAEAGMPLTLRQLHIRIGMPRDEDPHDTRLLQSLTSLTRRGLVQRVKPGLYGISGAVPTEEAEQQRDAGAASFFKRTTPGHWKTLAPRKPLDLQRN